MTPNPSRPAGKTPSCEHCVDQFPASSHFSLHAESNRASQCVQCGPRIQEKNRQNESARICGLDRIRAVLGHWWSGVSQPPSDAQDPHQGHVDLAALQAGLGDLDDQAIADHQVAA